MLVPSRTHFSCSLPSAQDAVTPAGTVREPKRANSQPVTPPCLSTRALPPGTEGKLTHASVCADKQQPRSRQPAVNPRPTELLCSELQARVLADSLCLC